MAARSSISRWTALATSTGCSSDLKARAKAPSTMPSRRRSKRCRTPNVPPPFASLAPDRIRGAGALAVVLTYSLPRAGGGTADAHGSGPCVRKDVRVQIPPRPLISCSLLRNDDHGAPGVAGQPAGDRTRDSMPDMLRRPYDERVSAEFLGRGGAFPSRAAPPGADVHLHLGVGHLVEFGQQPPLQRFHVPGNPYHLPGQRLAVDPGRAHVDDEERPAQPLGYPGRVCQRVAARRRAVVSGDNGMLEPERGRRRLAGRNRLGNASAPARRDLRRRRARRPGLRWPGLYGLGLARSWLAR